MILKKNKRNKKTMYNRRKIREEVRKAESYLKDDSDIIEKIAYKISHLIMRENSKQILVRWIKRGKINFPISVINKVINKNKNIMPRIQTYPSTMSDIISDIINDLKVLYREYQINKVLD